MNHPKIPDDEDAATARVAAAQQKIAEIQAELNKYWSRNGNGTPPVDLVAREHAANEEMRLADAEAKRILTEIMSGKRR